MNEGLRRRPRQLAMTGAVASTLLGLVYLALAGAPPRYLLVNAGALLVAFAVAGSIALAARRASPSAGVTIAAVALALLGTALFGARVDGAARWVGIGGLVLQPSLILLPLAVTLFARDRGPLAAVGIALTAAALALQPDRAMAGALAVALLALAVVAPVRSTIGAAILGAAGFAATLARPDTLPPMRFVEGVFASSFATHPLAGLATLAGAAVMVAPLAAGATLARGRREPVLIFGVVWFAIIVAAALGNYPTPIVGYGGSAIIGYVLAAFLLPRDDGVPSRPGETVRPARLDGESRDVYHPAPGAGRTHGD